MLPKLVALKVIVPLLCVKLPLLVKLPLTVKDELEGAEKVSPEPMVTLPETAKDELFVFASSVALPDPPSVRL